MTRFNPTGFTSVKSSSGNVVAAQQAVKDAVNLHKLNAEAAPNLTKLAKTDMINRANERNAVRKAELEVVKQGIKSVANVTHKKMEKDMNTEIRGIRADAGRFAGVLGLVGTLAEGAGNLAMLGGDKKLRDKAIAAMEETDNQVDSNMQKLIDSMNQRIQGASNKPGFEFSDGPQMPTIENGGLQDPYSTSPNPGGVQQPPAPGGSTPNAPGGSTPKPVSSLPANPTQSQAFNTIYELAKANGGAKFPEIVAAQAMHETGWLNNPNSVYFASGKTNPFGQTGDRGWGTIPRAGHKIGWTKYPDLKTAVDDNIKLWHDVGNHSQNYNAFNDRNAALRGVIASYSPNSDPSNIAKGFTEHEYYVGVNNILSSMNL